MADRRPKTNLKRSITHAIIILMSCATHTACDTEEDHISARLHTLQTVLQYRDAEGLYTLHLESQQHTTLCADKRKRLWKNIAKAPPQACQEAQHVLQHPPDKNTPRSEELLLLSELVSLRCQHPTSSCHELSHQWFLQRAQHSPWLKHDLKNLSITQIQRHKPNQATAYVTLHHTPHTNQTNQANQPSVTRLTLHMSKINGQWWLTTYPW